MLYIQVKRPIKIINVIGKVSKKRTLKYPRRSDNRRAKTERSPCKQKGTDTELFIICSEIPCT